MLATPHGLAAQSAPFHTTMISLLTTVGALAALAPADELSALHPSDAILYLELPDVPGALSAYRETAYAHLLGDEELHRAIGAVLGQETFEPWEALMDVVAQAEEDGDLPPLRELFAPMMRMAFSLSVRDGDALGVARTLERLDAAGANDSEYERMAATEMGLQVTLDFDSEESAGHMLEFLVSVLRDEGVELRSSTWPTGGADAELWQLPGGNDPLTDSARLLRHGSRLIGLLGNSDLAGLQERMTRSATEGARFAPGRALFDPPSGVTLFEFDNRVSDQLMGLVADPAISPLLDLAEGLLGPNLTMLTRGGHWRVQLRDGRFVTEGLHPAPAHSPLDGLFASQPLSEGALAMIHPDAIVAWAVHFDKSKALALLQEAAANAHGDPFAAIEAEYGFRPDRDLIAPLGPALTYSLPAEISLLSAPPLMVSIALSDAAAFRQGIAGLMHMIADEGLDEMSLSSRPYRGYDIYTLTFEMDLGLGELPIDPLAIIRPSLVVLDDRVLVTTNPTHVKKEIRRILKAEGALHPWLESGGIPEGATEVGLADWIQVVGKLYSGAKSMAPMLEALVGEELPFDLTQLPEPDVFTRHFGASQRWKRHTRQGVLHRAESSFGPEVPLGILAGVGAVLWLSSEPEWVPTPADPAPARRDDR